MGTIRAEAERRFESDEPRVFEVSAADGIFSAWIVIYALVGLQMAWLLRPFIGAPGSEFAWFRPRVSNVFEAIYECMRHVF